MQLQVFLPQRRVRGEIRVGRLWRGRYRLDGDAKPTEVALGEVDETKARLKLESIVKEKQQERAGLIAPKIQRETEGKAIEDVVEEFLRSREALGRDHKYVTGMQRQLLRMAREAKWKQLRDVTLDSFEKWRAQTKLSSVTLNKYLITANVFLNWSVDTQRIEKNPLQHAQMVSNRNHEKRERRAVTWEQLLKLISASGERGIIYLVAATTGLRRKELGLLQWRDLQLDGEAPCVHARSTTTKNTKKASLPLHPMTVDALQQLRSRTPHARGETLVFLKVPRIKRYRLDLAAVGIPYTDESGKVFDFHALRNTFCTLLQANGASIREAMELMRHSDPKLTTRIYTDAGHLPLRATVSKIGSVDSTDTRADTQNGVKTHEKRVSSVFDEKARLTYEDLKGMDPELYHAFDSEGNIADWALRLLGGGVKPNDYEMVRAAGFEPATPAV